MQKSLMDMSFTEISDLLSSWGEPGFRSKQVYSWLNCGVRPSGMQNLPKVLRQRLGEIYFGGAKILEVYKSTMDDTEKYLYSLDDGELVEGVLMRYKHGNTLCISTQVGCRMSCNFCASTLDGLIRNLTPGEMLCEVLCAERLSSPPKQGRNITNIVLMGSGEPLDNYDNVVSFLKRIVADVGISPRNISLSTCGMADKIVALIDDAPHVTLSVSLHAHNDELRDRLMPINSRHNIASLLSAAKIYASKTGRRIIFEYALIEGVNSSLQDAAALASLLKGLLCHVNLIPLNAVSETGLTGVTRSRAEDFMCELTKRNISSTIRREMGTDIDGACGQLRRRVIKSGGGS